MFPLQLVGHTPQVCACTVTRLRLSKQRLCKEISPFLLERNKKHIRGTKADSAGIFENEVSGTCQTKFVSYFFEHKTRSCGSHLGGLRSVGWCGMLIAALPISGKRLVPLTKSGALLGPPDLTKGGLTMVTYSDLIQTGILIVAIIALFIQANKKK